MELDDKLKAELIATARSLKGSERRIFMARTVKMLGPGGQRLAERELGWNRATIRKGMRELESGVICLDGLTCGGANRSRSACRISCAIYATLLKPGAAPIPNVATMPAHPA